MEDEAEQWSECLRILGTNIRRARNGGALGTSALARKAGLTPDECRRIENGNDPNPDLRTVAALAHALGTSIDDLLPRRWPRLGREGRATTTGTPAARARGRPPATGGTETPGRRQGGGGPCADPERLF
ncbi:helix-turn-helix domain-containing protein [Bifidobacterium bohemicum]|uniref:helix-turn-helix domain-containing protein n=1 Tax=Bifidobacterium bohemicum TaxID=638617 RepID=UPI0009437561|nr:helix-turn-helix transcriptional regulator [Bifidobacterium bohemicum]